MQHIIAQTGTTRTSISTQTFSIQSFCNPQPAVLLSDVRAPCVVSAEVAIQRFERSPAVARSNSYKSLRAILQMLRIAAKMFRF